MKLQLKQTIISLFTLLFLTSCEKKQTGPIPNADFSFSSSVIIEGQSIEFSDQSTNNPTNWKWDFGDGFESTEQNPTHIYYNAASVKVKLTASNNYGNNTEEKENCIIVSQKPPVFNSTKAYGSVSDVDGNTYKTIQIGTQTWMAENLKTTKFNDGASISLVTNNDVWNTAATPAYCWNSNDIAYKDPNGALYNWYAVNSGNLCPAGWHGSTAAEWTTLTNFLGGETSWGVAGELRETGNIHWTNINYDATNKTGFTALPSGSRQSAFAFFNFGTSAYWWTSTPNSSGNAFVQIMSSFSETTTRKLDVNKEMGASVRCIKD